jgi:tetratricopeptide (TPR) repeat protein
MRCTVINKLRRIAIFFPLLAVGTATQATCAHGQTANGRVITRPGSLEDTGPLGYWSQLSEQERAGGVLLGKIQVQDEPYLWNPVPIIVSCEGKIKNVTEADAKGNFLIRAIFSPAAPTLQEDAKRRLENEYEGCTVEASLAGYRSSTITITHRNLRDDPTVGKITLVPDKGATATEISATTKAAPPKASKAFQKARSDMMQQDMKGVESNLKEAVRLYPGFAEAWYELGRVQESNDPQSAAISMSKALAADPQFIPPYFHLAGLAAQGHNWQQVVDNTSQSLKMDPAGSSAVWYYDALGRSQLGMLDAAEISARKSLALDPQHRLADAEQLLATILIRKGNFTEARAHLDHLRVNTPAGAKADLLRKEIAQLDQAIAAKK